MALVLDLVDPQELQGFVRGIQLELERNRFVLQNYLQNRMIDEIEYSVTRGALRDEDSAEVRAWDTEVGLASRQGLEKMAGELAPIGRKIRLGEEERLRRRMINDGQAAPLLNAIYDDAAKMARAVIVRIERLRGEALEFASITLNENGVQQTVSYGRKAGHTVTAGTAWSTVATATPVADLRSWVQTYIDSNGVAPAFGLTSSAVISDLLRNAEIRGLLGVTAASPGLVSVAAVESVLNAFGLPPLVPNDENVRVNGAQQRVIGQRKLILMPPADEPLGGTFFGTTAEALDLVEARALQQDQAPGLVATVHKYDDPVSTWTKAAAIAFPVLINPDLTFTATV